MSGTALEREQVGSEISVLINMLDDIKIAGETPNTNISLDSTISAEKKTESRIELLRWAIKGLEGKSLISIPRLLIEKSILRLKESVAELSEKQQQRLSDISLKIISTRKSLGKLRV